MGSQPAALRVARAEVDAVDVNLSLLAEQRPELDYRGSHVTARLFRLRELFVDALAKVHGQFGLKPRMFLVLAALYRSGPPYRLSPAELNRYLMWTSAGLSQLLDRMVAAGLIRRLPNPRDHRGVLVSLSAEGARVIAAVLDLHCQAEIRLIAPLSEAERRSLVFLLRKLLLATEGPQMPFAAEARAARAAGRTSRKGSDG